MSTKYESRKLIKDNILMNATSIAEKIVFFVINVIITRYLSQNDFGEYATALGYATFFSLFSTLGVTPSLIRAISLDPENEDKHLGNVILIKTALSAITYLLLAVSLLFINKYSQNTLILILLLGLVRIGNEYMSTFFSFYNAKQKFVLTCVYVLLFDLFFLVSTVSVVFARGDYFAFAYWRLIIVIAFLIVIAVHTSLDHRIRYDASKIRSFLLDTIPFGVATIFGNVLQRINLIVLTLLKGETAGGIFSNGYIIIVSLMFIPQNVDKVIIPYLYRKFRHDHSKDVQQIFNISTRILGILSFFVVLISINFGGDIIVFLFSEKYLHSITTLKIASFCLIFQFTTAGAIITALDRQRERMNITIITSVINVIACYALSYLYGAEGVAIAMIITFASMWVMYIAYLHFVHHLSLIEPCISLATVGFAVLLCSVANHWLESSALFSSILLRMPIISLSYLVMIYFVALKPEDIRFAKGLFSKKNRGLPDQTFES